MTDGKPDQRLNFPSTERNRDPIRIVLEQFLPATGSILEIASGSGQHAAYFARYFPNLTWQPSDPEPNHLASIAAWAAHAGVSNLRPPLALDVGDRPWPVDPVDGVLAINLIHIAPWAVAEHLVAGAAETLAPAGLLYLYGPYRVGGADTAPSNAAFDADLRARDPSWGVRDLEAVAALAENSGLRLVEVVDMPANNKSVIFRRC